MGAAEPTYQKRCVQLDIGLLELVFDKSRNGSKHWAKHFLTQFIRRQDELVVLE